MRKGPLYETARFNLTDEEIRVHERPTIPAPAPALVTQVTQQEYDWLEEEEIEIALDSLRVSSLDDGWLEVVQ